MKAARFDYVRPQDLDQAMTQLTALSDNGRAIKWMGGSQSLGPMLNLRLARPDVVLDVSGIASMRQVQEDEDRFIIGAAITHAEIEDGVFPALRGHLMQAVAGRIAYRSVRNRGTVAGSLAHADPAADWVVVLSALGAQIQIASATGTRTMTMPDFMHAAYTTDLAENELITAISVPVRTPHTRWGYYKFCRKPGEFADASCAAWFDPQQQIARVAVGALDGAPVLLHEWAAEVARQGALMLKGHALHAQIERIAPNASQAKKQLLATAVARCLAQVLGQGHA